MKTKERKLDARSKDKLMSSSVEISELKEKLETLIEEKEKAEEQARETFLRLEQIISCMPGSVYWKDRNGVYRGCNDAILQLVGLSRADILGKTDFEYSEKLGWPKKIAEAFWEVDQEVMESGISRLNFEEPPFKLANGEVIYQLDNKVPLRDEAGNVIGVVGIGIDITELKNTQALLKKEKERAESLSKAKSDFIANMSHDVKTPISGIIGLSSLLKERLKNEELAFVQDIASCADQLMGFFNNCLEMAKSENIDLTLIKEQFSLKQLTEQISKLFRPAIENKKLNFSIHYDPKIPDVLFGSHPAIYRILLNLTGNAIKFTDKGGVTIGVSLGNRSTRKKPIIKIMIQDTGMGIPKDKHKFIFEQFTRLTPSYQGLYEGTGIGLFVISKLVKALNGEIHLSSEEGKGSTFTVVLPLDTSLLDQSEYKETNLNISSTDFITIDTTSGQSSQPKTKQSISNSKVIKVLLVEDNRIAQYSGKILLSDLNCDVDIAASGSQALKHFEPGKYDLVFTDIGLPDITGDKLAIQLREREKESAYQVPIIALTAHLSEHVVTACKEAGMQTVLNKPLSSPQALALIDRYVPDSQSNKVPSQLAKVKPPSPEINALIQGLPKTKSELFELEKHGLLDVEKAIELTGNQDVLKEVLEQLVKKVIPEETLNLRASYAEKNWDRIESIAHKLKGGCFYCGTTKLFYASQYLELYPKRGHSQLLKKLYDQCITVLEETRQCIEEWLVLNR